MSMASQFQEYQDQGILEKIDIENLTPGLFNYASYFGVVQTRIEDNPVASGVRS